MKKAIGKTTRITAETLENDMSFDEIHVLNCRHYKNLIENAYV